MKFNNVQWQPKNMTVGATVIGYKRTWTVLQLKAAFHNNFEITDYNNCV